LISSGVGIIHSGNIPNVDGRELGIGIVPYSPLGRGFFSGKATVEKIDENDKRLVCS
jgi:hypothetical protein